MLSHFLSPLKRTIIRAFCVISFYKWYKVQQKISGCFRSTAGGDMFCRIRGYLSSCKKQGVGASEAMRGVFKGGGCF